MTDDELRELDAWLAEHVFDWRQVETVVLNDVRQDIGPYWWPTEYGNPLDPNSGATMHTRPPRYSWDTRTFQLVKREIERRGWQWSCTSPHPNGHDTYEFQIFMHGTARLRTPFAYAGTEELAGCLAFKAAVEAASGGAG